MEHLDGNANEVLQGRNSRPSDVLLFIESLKAEVVSKRLAYIKERIVENSQKMAQATNNFLASAHIRGANKPSIVKMVKQTDMNTSNQENDCSSVPCIESTKVEKLPSYTTWIFLDRNQRMTEYQSAVGQKQIYYDHSGGEALVASDNDKERIDVEEEKKEFSDIEDHILLKTTNEFGLADAVLNALARCFCTKPCQIKARHEALVRRENAAADSQNGSSEASSSSFLEQDLNAALDTFDRLFCRRCLVFNCRLHGCAQHVIFPAEKQCPMSLTDEEQKPCGSRCYELRLRNQPSIQHSSSAKTMLVEKSENHKRNSKRSAEHVEGTLREKNIEKAKASIDLDFLGNVTPRCGDPTEGVSLDKGIWKEEPYNAEWTPLEKSLLERVVEIFGKNSCLITRNLMDKMKTCSEVFQFLNCTENLLALEAGKGLDPLAESCPEGDGNKEMGTQLGGKSKFVRRRGKIRCSKFTTKTSGYRSIGRRISVRKGELNHKYDPCGCKFACEKDCLCYLNKTRCEKYCGCPKSCKNRFRGCRCAKNQCRTPQCSCVAANRECDPDVCSNCCISGGDGTCGAPPQKEKNYNCMNMKLLQNQHQKVLLGRSHVSGWGAFLKDACEKDECIGEYRGEVITHDEADKRGKIYDRINSSYLFDLNDQQVLDARQMGNKLKFANHSSNPNCHGKILLVAGDHRVGIFANERISAGQELFYDYCYKKDVAPPWAKDHEASSSKKDEDYTPSKSRVKKTTSSKLSKH